MLSRAIAFLLLVCFFSIPAAGGTEKDSIVLFSDLTFHSEYEKKVFHRYYYDHVTDTIGLLLAVDPRADSANSAFIGKKLHDKANQLQSAFNSKKDDRKRIDYLYTSLHDEYLRKYQEVIDFDKIFSTGTFNCVTGTALFALVMGHLGVPYALKEMPGHVYLIAYPKTSGIQIEVTDPIGKFFSYDKQTKINYVNYLKKSKQVTDEEVKDVGVDSIFARFVDTDKEISMVQLASNQYINEGIMATENERLADAYVYFEKAFILNPTDKNMLAILTTASGMLGKAEYGDDMTQAKLLIKLSRLGPTWISDAAYVSEFANMTQKYLIDRNDLVTYDTLYHMFTTGIKRDSVRLSCDYVYNFQRGRVLAMQSKYVQSLPFFEKAYVIRPTNIEAQTFFLGAFFEKLKAIGHANQLESHLDEFSAKYPELKLNSDFAEMSTICYLGISGESFELGNTVKGDEYLVKFEKVMDATPDVRVSKSLMADTYAEASKYYFKKGKYDTAKAYLKRGLKYDPDNAELKRKLQMF